VRALVGWLFLIGLCGLAWYLQSRWSERVRAERETLRSAPTDLRGREQTWGELRIGRPSGAAPIDLPDSAMDPFPGESFGAPPPGQEGWDAEAIPGSEPPTPIVFEYVVPKGRVLSKICEDFYDSGRSPIPERVAEYNGLRSPDELRAGFKLLLPTWEELFPDLERP
jgi:hypothetical protein